MQLALGPILTYWPRERVFDFYQQVAESAVDIVYIGETVCSRRHELRLDDWIDVADLMTAMGKQAVLSSQALIESSSELASLRKITANGRYLVEANDFGALQTLPAGTPFVAGHYLNVYNSATLDLLASQGAVRWIAPMELGRQQLADILGASKAAPATEVFVHGRMPLALSARCFTARNRNLPKDDCRFSCLEHPQGLPLQTREGKAFLVLNGTQTQSANVQSLVEEFAQLVDLGVAVLRISPQAEGTLEVIDTYDQLRQGRIGIADARARIDRVLPGPAANGYWHGKPGMERHGAGAPA
jgi:collagenase-like PrtC family protease